MPLPPKHSRQIYSILTLIMCCLQNYRFFLWKIISDYGFVWTKSKSLPSFLSAFISTYVKIWSFGYSQRILWNLAQNLKKSPPAISGTFQFPQAGHLEHVSWKAAFVFLYLLPLSVKRGRLLSSGRIVFHLLSSLIYLFLYILCQGSFPSRSKQCYYPRGLYPCKAPQVLITSSLDKGPFILYIQHVLIPWTK